MTRAGGLGGKTKNANKPATASSVVTRVKAVVESTPNGFTLGNRTGSSPISLYKTSSLL